MKKIKLILFCIVCTQAALLAQPVKFRKVIGNAGYDFGYYAQQDHDKGYMLIGSTSSFGESADMYAVKTDSMGIPYLHKSFGGISVEKGLSVKRTSDNGFILLGYTNSTGAGGYDIYMVKIDSAFGTQWEKTYGGADWEFGNCVQQTSDGGYILCGSTFSYGYGNQDYYLIKTNATGDTLWTKTYGGLNDDVAKSVIQTSDGGYAVTGYTKSMGDANGDFYTIKTDSMGDTLWTNKFGGAGIDLANGIVESMSGDYFVAGENASLIPSHGAEATVLKLSATGAYVNSNTFGGTGTDYDGYNYISEDAAGKIAMAGTTNSFGVNGDVLMVILYSDLSFFNATTFGSLENEYGYSIEPTADGCYIICGSTNSYNNGLDDIYLIKTDSMGFSGSTGSETFYVTGIDDVAAAAESKFAIYPNPAGNSIILSMDTDLQGEEMNVSITDMLGRQTMALTVSGTNTVINLESLKDGIYLVTVKNESISSAKKLIIHH